MASDIAPMPWAAIASETNFVVAILVELSPADGLGAVGVPVSAAEAALAYVVEMALPSASAEAIAAVPVMEALRGSVNVFSPPIS